MNRTTHQIEPEEVMASLDGELAPERAATVAAHIDACEECAAIAASLRGVSARLATWQIEPAPQQLEKSIRAAASVTLPPKESQRVPFSLGNWIHTRRRWVWPLAGASVTAALVLGVLLSSKMGVDELRLAPPAPQGVRVVPSPPSPSFASPESERGGGGSGGGRASATNREREDQRFAFGAPGTLGKLYAEQAALGPGRGPMMIRTASVTLETKHFDATRAAIERIVRAHGGHMGQLQTAAPANQARTLTATLRIPAERLDAALAEVKNLGRVVKESQGSDEVTTQYVDLVARLSNARNTEQRLVEILRTRTGKVTEVLEVEREIAEVREQIESMDAQRKALENRVALSMVSLELHEEFEKPIGVAPPSTGTKLWNAMADGLDGAFESVLALAMFLLRAGPSLLLWAALLFLPARSVYRKLRETSAAAQ